MRWNACVSLSALCAIVMKPMMTVAASRRRLRNKDRKKRLTHCCIYLHMFTVCCLDHLYSEFYAFPESLVYAVMHMCTSSKFALVLRLDS
jgi:hypothetical protein